MKKSKITTEKLPLLTRADVPDLDLQLWLEIKQYQLQQTTKLKSNESLSTKLPKETPKFKRNRPKLFVREIDELFKFQNISDEVWPRIVKKEVKRSLSAQEEKSLE